MTRSAHYKSNLRDIEFNLFEFLDVGSTSLGRGPFADLDVETARELLRAHERICSREIAASFVEADRVPLRLTSDGDVLLPEGLKRSIKAYYDAGLHLLGLPSHMGGAGAPPTVAWAAFELVAGANAAACFYLFSVFVAHLLDRVGTEAQKKRFIPGLVERRWGGSMALTEPDAGSDVGAGRTRARHLRGDEWEIEGVKRFITNGDYDGTENVVHLVLARPDGAAPGTKGLSMFIVPKRWVHEDGSLGERNGVYVTSLENKMGVKGSATCELTFGAGPAARGLLVGGVHDGIRQMFHLIEHARMAVGTKSMAAISTAYLNALDYARIRTQGADLTRAQDKAAPRVVILYHPDVRRMLMAQKAHAEGMRALTLFTASVQDEIALVRGHDPPAAARLAALNDLLLPIVKGYCSEKAYEILSLSFQTFGGSGYTQDHPIEQYIRDQKIDTLYEGTTHIQALDLLLRKFARDGGVTLRELLGRVRTTVAGLAEDGPLAAERRGLGEALRELERTFTVLLGKMGESIYHAGLQGNRVLFALGEVLIGWLLTRHAEVALRRREESAADRAFYDGKIASARWWCRDVLPGVGLTRRLVEEGTLELMDLPAKCF